MRRIIATGLAALTLGALASAPAWAGDDVLRRKGACSGSSEWEMRVRMTDAGTFRVRWDVDSGIVGESWNMSVDHDGTQIASGTRLTNLAGEAEFRLRGVPNLAGTDTFTGHATNPATGETCQGSLTF